MSNSPDAEPLRRAGLAEAVATFAFVLAMCGARIAEEWRPESGMLTVALGGGLMLGAAVALATPFGGGHLNPAVTLAALVAGRTPWRRARILLLAQFVGALLAAVCVVWMFNGRGAGDGMGDALRHAARDCALGAPSWSPTLLSAGTALLVEAVLTFVLVCVQLGALSSGETGRAAGAVVVGMAAVAVLLIALPLTGAGLNPARALAPQLLGGKVTAGLWSQHWVYWIGPLAGGCAAGVMLRRLAPAPPPARRVQHHETTEPAEARV